MAPLNDPPFYLHRLIQRLMHKQEDYQRREDYVVGNHPLPEGDPRYVKALRDLQLKSKTNYIALAHKAVTDRMRVRAFKFSGEIDKDAMRIWKANNMALQSQVAVGKAADLSDIYALVSPPEDDGEPIITIEDPRTCITEPDPVDPMKAICGLKFYEDTILDFTVAILYFPERIYVFKGPKLRDFLDREKQYSPENIVNSSGGFVVVSIQDNPLGEVPLVRGAWQPKWGLRGMAECEDGGFDIQDRINWVVLSRLVVTKSQAYRQRWMTGAQIPKTKDGAAKKTPFEPGADMIWAVVDKDAKFGDFEQADIRQALEAARDDIGDFAAITQTPVTYLTNKMVNVSGETLTAAQTSLISKTKVRMEAMGWFFERIIKLCFLYKGDSTRAADVEAETLWADPETRSMAEVADMVGKFSAAGIPPRLTLEKTGYFSPEEVEVAVKEIEEAKAQEKADQLEMTKAAKPIPQAGAKNSARPSQ